MYTLFFFFNKNVLFARQLFIVIFFQKKKRKRKRKAETYLEGLVKDVITVDRILKRKQNWL